MVNDRLIMHLDMDAFFASVEQAANPSWQHRPLAVAGTGRGVVASASYEARRLGIKAGQPVTEARRLAPQTIFVPAQHAKYLWVSLGIMQLLQSYSPLVEPYSIDEAFVDFSGEPKAQSDLLLLVRQIQEHIYKTFQLSCSIGIANNKLLAKIASDFRKPGGITIVPKDEALMWLHSLPVNSLPGVGPRTASFLESVHIHSIGQLAECSETQLFQWFGKNGRWVFQMAQGQDDSPVISQLPSLKSFGQEWTLPEDSTDQELIEAALSWLSGLVGRRLRAEARGGRTVTIKLRNAIFHTWTRAETFHYPVYLDDEIAITARKLLRECWEGNSLRLVGVKVSNISPIRSSPEQLTLWPDERQRKYEMYITVDKLRNKYGESILLQGSGLASMLRERRKK